MKHLSYLLFLLLFTFLVNCTHDEPKPEPSLTVYPVTSNVVNISIEDMEQNPDRYFKPLSGARAGLRRPVLYEGSTNNFLLAGQPGYINTQQLLNPYRLDKITLYDSLYYATGQTDLYGVNDNGVNVICRNYNVVIMYTDGTYEKGQYFAKDEGPQYERYGDFENETNSTSPKNKQVLKRTGQYVNLDHINCGIVRRNHYYILNDTTKLVIPGNSTNCNSHVFSFNHTFQY